MSANGSGRFIESQKDLRIKNFVIKGNDRDIRYQLNQMTNNHLNKNMLNIFNTKKMLVTFYL